MGANEKPFILVVDDDPSHRLTLRTLITSWGYNVDEIDDGVKVAGTIKLKKYALVIMDIRMAVMDGIEALYHIKNFDPGIPVLIMTAYSSVKTAVEALKSGAFDYLTKPLDFDELKLSIERAIDHSELVSENTTLKNELRKSQAGKTIIGNSPVISELMKMLEMVSPSEATVLITGESGTGKEMVAKSVHAGSGRSDKSFVAVNCAAISENLLESELFGHEKGAYTGAESKRDGLFKKADKGTIFLDEIGEMSSAMQAKLLRVLQEGEIQRVGSDVITTVDVRIVAATNRVIPDEVKKGKFREDLYYRLNVVNLKVPSLHERGEDIILLANYFMTRFAEKYKKSIKGFSRDALLLLRNHHWPGNVRELENAIERAVILLTSEYITEQELPEGLLSETSSVPRYVVTGKPRSLEEIEKDAILDSLNLAGGNKSEAARNLGINRKTLHKKLKSYNIDKPDS